MKLIVGLLFLLFTMTAEAGFRGFQSTSNLGLFNEIKCSTGLTCTKVGKQFQIVSSPSLSGDLTIGGTTPYLTIGDAGAEDAGVVFDGNAVDFNLSLDDSSDQLVIGLGSAAGTTNRMAFNSGDLNIVLGDASAADMSLIWDGNAQDFQIGLDDSVDKLVIGLGSALGTTDAVRIDANQDVEIVQDLFAGGLAANTLFGFRQKQVAASSTTITASQCGSSFVAAGAAVMNLPEASTVIGCRFTFIDASTADFDINPNDGTDQIASITASGGTITPSAGDAIRITDIGSSVTLEAVGNDLWVAVGHNGPITDVN